MNILYKGLKVIAILLILISATNIFKNVERSYNLKPYNGGIVVEQDFVVDDCSDLRQYIVDNDIKIYRAPSSWQEPYYYSNTNDTSVPVNSDTNYNSVDYLCSSNNSGDYHIDTSESSVTVEEFNDYLATTYGAEVVFYSYEMQEKQFYISDLKEIIFLISASIMLLLLMLREKRDKYLNTTQLYQQETKYIAASFITYVLLFAITGSYLSNYLLTFIVLLILATNLLVYSFCFICKKLQNKKVVAWILFGFSIVSLLVLSLMYLPKTKDIVTQYKNYQLYQDNADFYDDFYYINGGVYIEGMPNYNEVSTKNIEQYLISFYIGEDGTVYVNENYIKTVYGEEYLGYNMYIHEDEREKYCGSDLKCTDDVYVYQDDLEVMPLTNSHGYSQVLINPTIIVSESNTEGYILPLNDVQTVEFYDNLIAENSVEPDNTIGLQLYSYDEILSNKYRNLLLDLFDYVSYVVLGIIFVCVAIIYLIKLRKK